MYSYSLATWLLFFFIYCFLGWIWESSYVSIKSKKWTNRGFMNGPLLPIYGSGAIIILIATLPLKNSMVLVYFSGMIAATVLEYFTGAAMEAMFKVRYWDYSNRFMNLNGHICLKCSLLWGAFSILMVKVIHVPIENMVLRIPESITQIISFSISILVAADFATSFRDAIDLKNIILSIENNSAELEKMLKKRMDVTIAFAEADLQEAKDKINAKIDELNLQKHLLRKQLESTVRYSKLLKRHPGARSIRFSETFDKIKSLLDI